MLCETLKSVFVEAIYVSIRGAPEAVLGLGLGWSEGIGTSYGRGHVESKTDPIGSSSETMKGTRSLATWLETAGSSLT